MKIDDESAEPQHVLTQAGDEDFGSDIELDADLEAVLAEAEFQRPAPIENAETSDTAASEHAGLAQDVMDIEDVASQPMEVLSPFQMFRGKGRLSVSDLVGTVWCEVQVSDSLDIFDRG